MKKYMKLFVLLTVCLIAICMSACSSDNEATETGEQYVDDAVVNMFINDFNKLSDGAITEVEESADGNGYTTTINGYFTEITNNQDEFYVTINADSDNPDMSELADEFCNMAYILDNDNETSDMETVYSQLLEDDVMVENGTASTVTYTFIPTKELSNGLSPGRIAFMSPAYGK